MSDIKIQPSATGSGTVTITAPTTNTARVITLPDSAGTLLDENSSVPAANLTGTVADARISALTASKLTGALPAISGASLTGIVTDPLDYASSSTIVGWSGFTSSRKILWITVVGKLMNVSWHIEGTSNSATTSFTVPHAIVSFGVVPFSASSIYGYTNSTGELGGMARIDGGGTVVTIIRPSGSWATSGDKITAGSFSVPIA